jgi:hypothetical protein
MDKLIKALHSNFDLLDYFYIQSKIPNKKEDNLFFNAKCIEKNHQFDYINLHPDQFSWEQLCYDYHVPWLENLIDTHYDEINWSQLSQNKAIVWNEKLLTKYWNNLYIGFVISHSSTHWDENLVRFFISKLENDSSKILWLQEFANITNIDWNLQMILDFPTSYWIRKIVEAKTLHLSFEDIKNYKEKLKKDVFEYLQEMPNLIWTIEMILEFNELLNFKILSKSKNVDWSEELIARFCDVLDFELMSKNQSIQISEDIVKKFQDRWNFQNLSSNPSVKWSVELIRNFICRFDLNEAFQNNIVGINDEFITECKDYIDWGDGCGNYIYTSAKIARYNHIPISVETLVEKGINWEVGYCKPYWDEKGPYEGEWHQFSTNQFLTPLHLEVFEAKLSWELISSNEYIPLTNELLIKHSAKFVWSKVLVRNDFKLEHFYTICQYLNYDMLYANSNVLVKLLQEDKNVIYTYIKKNVEILGEFRHSLRSTPYERYNNFDDDDRQIKKFKRELIVKQCKRANDKYSKINRYDDRYDNEDQDQVYFDRIYNWLREYYKVIEMISYITSSFTRERGYTPERDIQNFFDTYIRVEKEFKKNYFEVYKK